MWLRPFKHHLLSTLGWIAFLGWGAVCAATGLDPVYAWIGTPDRHLGWITWVIFGLLFLVGLNLADQLVIIGRAVVVATAGVALYCQAELIGRAPVDLVVESTRLGGPFGSPAYLGAACVLLLPITASVAADTRETSLWRRIAAIALVGGVVALVASQTRAAWLGFAASVIVLAPKWWPRVRERWWLLVPGLVILVLVTPIGLRLRSVLEGDLQARVDEWTMGAALISTAPLLGVGPEGYRLAFPSVVDAEYERRYTRQATPDRAHNGALDTAATFGLPGLAAYIAAAVFLVGRAWKAIKSERPVVVGAGAALIAYLVQQQFLFPIAEIDVVFWLLAGIVVAVTGPLHAVTKPPVVVGVLWGSLAVLSAFAGALDVAADHLVAESQRHPAEAAAVAERATNLRPDSIRYWLVAADTRARNGDLRTADEIMDRALSISPLDPILLATKGRVLLAIAESSGSSEDVGRAVIYYERLLAGDPNNGQNQLRAGTAYALAGAFADAEKALITAADLAPTSPVPPSNLARLYLTTGDLDLALAAYRQARSIDPTAPGLDEIAALLVSAGVDIDD